MPPNTWTLNLHQIRSHRKAQVDAKVPKRFFVHLLPNVLVHVTHNEILWHLICILFHPEQDFTESYPEQDFAVSYPE